MSLLSFADGQVAATATQIANGGQCNGSRVSVSFCNTSGTNSETLLILVSRNGGTNRRVFRCVLAANETCYLNNVPLDNTPGLTVDSLLASATDAATVDYFVSMGGPGPMTCYTADANGNTKQVNGTTLTAATTITATSSTALVVGLGGATNPALQVDTSTGSSATGIKIKSAAAAGGVAISVISSGAAESLTIDAATTGTITLNGTGTGSVIIGSSLTLSSKNVITDTTGTRIATATTQKLGFFNASPVAQPAANTDTTTGAAGSTTTVFLNTTFTGNAGTAAFTIGGAITALKALGLLAA